MYQVRVFYFTLNLSQCCSSDGMLLPERCLIMRKLGIAKSGPLIQFWLPNVGHGFMDLGQGTLVIVEFCFIAMEANISLQTSISRTLKQVPHWNRV